MSFPENLRMVLAGVAANLRGSWRPTGLLVPEISPS